MVFVRILHRDQTRGAVITGRAVPAFVEDLEVVIEGHPPAVVAGFGPIEEPFHLFRARIETPETGALQHRQTVGRFHPGKGMQALGEPEGAIRAMADGIDQLMGVPDAETREHHPALIRFAIAIGVLEMQQLVEVADIHPARPGLDALDHGQAFRKTRLPVRLAIVVGVLQHEDVVGGFFPRQGLRVGRRAGHITTAAFIPGDLHRLGHTFRFGGKEIDLITLRHRESRLLLFRGLHRRGRRRRGGRRQGHHRFPLGDGGNAVIQRGDERFVTFKTGPQRGAGGARFAEELGHPVAIHKGPVGRPPAVKPQPVLFHDGFLQG